MNAEPITWLRRNQLVFLVDGAWRRIARQAWDETDRACVDWWAENRLPLVVTRQPTAGGPEIALGLAAPSRFKRRRIALRVVREEILYADGFPRMSAIAKQFKPDFARAWGELARRFEEAGCGARVYGSRGWQAQTHLLYVRPGSDIDLTMPVTDPEMADGICRLLYDFESAGARDARIDGELVFPDGSAVAWREWQRWRDGDVEKLMVKRIGGVNLVADVDWLCLELSC